LDLLDSVCAPGRLLPHQITGSQYGTETSPILTLNPYSFRARVVNDWLLARRFWLAQARPLSKVMSCIGTSSIYKCIRSRTTEEMHPTDVFPPCLSPCTSKILLYQWLKPRDSAISRSYPLDVSAKELLIVVRTTLLGLTVYMSSTRLWPLPHSLT
jgi:hypothetical protein